MRTGTMAPSNCADVRSEMANRIDSKSMRRIRIRREMMRTTIPRMGPKMMVVSNHLDLETRMNHALHLAPTGAPSSVALS
jgi:hypothetical protein